MNTRKVKPTPLWQRIICALIGVPAFFGVLAEIAGNLARGEALVTGVLFTIPLLIAVLLFCSIAAFGTLPADLIRQRRDDP